MSDKIFGIPVSGTPAEKVVEKAKPSKKEKKA